MFLCCFFAFSIEFHYQQKQTTISMNWRVRKLYTIIMVDFAIWKNFFKFKNGSNGKLIKFRQHWNMLNRFGRPTNETNTFHDDNNNSLSSQKIRTKIDFHNTNKCIFNEFVWHLIVGFIHLVAHRCVHLNAANGNCSYEKSHQLKFYMVNFTVFREFTFAILNSHSKSVSSLEARCLGNIQNEILR